MRVVTTMLLTHLHGETDELVGQDLADEFVVLVQLLYNNTTEGRGYEKSNRRETSMDESKQTTRVVIVYIVIEKDECRSIK